MSISSSFAFTDAQQEITSKEKQKVEFEELTKNGEEYIYFYTNPAKEQTVVISGKSIHDVKIYVNLNDVLYESRYTVSNINSKTSNDISNFSKIKDEILSFSKSSALVELGSKKLESLGVTITEKVVNTRGITNSTQQFINYTGRGYIDHLRYSTVYDGKKTEIWESKNHSVNSVSTINFAPGAALALVLSVTGMPKSAAIALGIVVLVQDIYIVNVYGKDANKYKAQVIYQRDVDINYQTRHETQNVNTYNVWEVDNSYYNTFQHGYEDAYYSDYTNLIKLALGIIWV